MIEKKIYILEKGYKSSILVTGIAYDREPLCVSDRWDLINLYAIKLCNDILKTGEDEWLSSVYENLKSEDLIYWSGFGYHSVGFSLEERIIFRIRSINIKKLEEKDLEDARR